MHPSTILATATAALMLLNRDKNIPDVGATEQENTYGLPNGRPISRELKRWFRRQREHSLKVAKQWGIIPDQFPSLADYNDPMAQAMVPIMTAYWSESGKRTTARLGLDPETWQVVNPHLRDKIQEASFSFCQATNQTTTLLLSTALERLRDELTKGLVDHGETIPELTRRVKGVFRDAETWRAKRIAVTEASRAVHSAENEAAIQSGVVVGIEWMASGDACSYCLEVASKVKSVQLGQKFATFGDHPEYSQVYFPPLHPNCQCSTGLILAPEYGGPERPEYGETIDIQAGEPEPEYSTEAKGKKP